eukprot:1146638-Pelagomonas_calceolata.AAC.2
MAATISVRPPVRDLEHEGEALAFIEPRYVDMHCVESRLVANTAQLPVNFWYSRSQALQQSWVVVV